MVTCLVREEYQLVVLGRCRQLEVEELRHQLGVDNLSHQWVGEGLQHLQEWKGIWLSLRAEGQWAGLDLCGLQETVAGGSQPYL